MGEPTGCESCDLQADEGSTVEAFRDLHRAVHALGATVMLELLPVARGGLSLFNQGRVPVDEDKVAYWRRIASQNRGGQLMGYAYYRLHDGREAGYSVEATCDEPDCEAQINRGLAYLCGDEPAVWGSNEHGCGRYFCYDHLLMWDRPANQLCPSCAGAEDPT